MNVSQTDLPGVLLIEPKVFGDSRGAFWESFSLTRYADAGIDMPFVQDNVSISTKGVLRGLHFQNPQSQGKLVHVLSGGVLDVAVDIRVGSPTFARWVAYELSEDNHRQLYIPPGFAHGFCVMSEKVIFSYKCTDYYNASAEAGVIWNDPQLDIDWPITEPMLSGKDAAYPSLKDIPTDKLPKYERS